MGQSFRDKADADQLAEVLNVARAEGRRAGIEEAVNRLGASIGADPGGDTPGHYFALALNGIKALLLCPEAGK